MAWPEKVWLTLQLGLKAKVRFCLLTRAEVQGPEECAECSLGEALLEEASLMGETEDDHVVL